MRLRPSWSAFATLAVAAVLSFPGVTSAASPAVVAPSAMLGGRPIELARVGTLHCHDFRWPQIECFATATELDADASAALAATAVDYVRIFENGAYNGASMYLSQNYTILALIGWNDRISSFKALNSETGSFHTDWFYGGSEYTFCCNQNVMSLGSYDNTFSSVRRT